MWWRGIETLFCSDHSVVKQLGCGKTCLWNSSIVIQLSYDMTWMRKPWYYSFAPLWWDSFIWQGSSKVSALAFPASPGGNAVFDENKVCSLSQRGTDLHREKFLPWSLIGLSFSTSSQFQWSKKHFPDWLEWSHSDWVVKRLMRI